MEPTTREMTLTVPCGWEAPHSLYSMDASKRALAVDLGCCLLERELVGGNGSRELVERALAEFDERSASREVELEREVRGRVEMEAQRLQRDLEASNAEVRRLCASMEKWNAEAASREREVAERISTASTHARAETETRARAELERSERARDASERSLAQSTELQAMLARGYEGSLQMVHKQHAHDKCAMAQSVSSLEQRLAAAISDGESKTRRIEELSVAAKKGNALEQDLTASLCEAGLHAWNVSKGGFNSRYHDLLACAEVLLTDKSPKGLPLLVRANEASQSPRVSIEWKGHRSSSALTQELMKFASVRNGMIHDGLAECFCFVCTAPIPGRLRCDIEVMEHNGAPVVTGYLGAFELSMAEVGVFVQCVLSTQQRLMQTGSRLSPAHGAVVSRAKDALNAGIGHLRPELDRCERMEKAAAQLVADARDARLSLVRTIALHVATLKHDLGAAPTNATQEVFDSMLSAETLERRRTIDKVLRNKDEFAAARDELRAESPGTGVTGKRKADDA